jgi:hypothetical protein
MAETEFHDPERIKQLTALKALLNYNTSSTIHAHLWLSDVDKLTILVNILHSWKPYFGLLSGMQRSSKSVSL